MDIQPLISLSTLYGSGACASQRQCENPMTCHLFSELMSPKLCSDICRIQSQPKTVALNETPTLRETHKKSMAPSPIPVYIGKQRATARGARPTLSNLQGAITDGLSITRCDLARTRTSKAPMYLGDPTLRGRSDRNV